MSTAEGEAKFKEATKLTKKTLTRRKPDWSAAAPLFERAAVVFRNAKAFDRAIEAHVAAAEAHEMLESLFMAGKNLESAAQMARDMKKFPKAAELLQQAQQMYVMKGQFDKAAQVGVKAGQMLENDEPAIAMQLYRRTLEIFRNDDHLVFSAETYRCILKLLLRQQKYFEAIDLLKEQVGVFEELKQFDNRPRAFLAIIILTLHLGDLVGAEKHFQQFVGVQGFLHSTESKLSQQLLDAFNHQDQAGVDRVVKQQSVALLEPALAALARRLKVSNDVSQSNMYKVEQMPDLGDDAPRVVYEVPPASIANEANASDGSNSNGQQQPAPARQQPRRSAAEYEPESAAQTDMRSALFARSSAVSQPAASAAAATAATADAPRSSSPPPPPLPPKQDSAQPDFT